MELNIVDEDLQRLVSDGVVQDSRWESGTARALQMTIRLLGCCHNHRDVRNLTVLSYRPTDEDPNVGHIIVNLTVLLRVRLTNVESTPRVDVLSTEESIRRN